MSILCIIKNGFSVMASCCLMIETLETFYQGWENSDRKSKSAFLSFFTRDKNFNEFTMNNMPTIFYENIRCGILHQGETTGGWSISRDGEKMLDLSEKKIDATVFSRTLKSSLDEFKKELDDSAWDSIHLKNVRTKLKAIIKVSKE